jgi:hypothetical protein
MIKFIDDNFLWLWTCVILFCGGLFYGHEIAMMEHYKKEMYYKNRMKQCYEAMGVFK